LSKLEIFAIVGYLVGLPATWWCWNDLARFHRPVWVGYGNRSAWRRSLIVGVLALGWPALFVALGWRTGRTRAELIGELQRLPGDADARSSAP